MRIGAVKLFQPHYYGRSSDLDRGVDGVKVFPIAIGNYREQVQPCGVTIVPSESATRRIVIAIPKWDRDERDGNQFLTPDDKVFAKSSGYWRNRWEETWKIYGTKRDNPKWPWVCTLTTATYLLPADEYEAGAFLFAEWEASVEKISSEVADLQHALADRKIEVVAKLNKAAKGTGVTRLGFFPSDGSLSAEVEIQEALNFAVKKRRLTRAVADQFPFKGKVLISDIDEFFSFIGKKPKDFDQAIQEYSELIGKLKVAQAEHQRLVTCDPRNTY